MKRKRNRLAAWGLLLSLVATSVFSFLPLYTAQAAGEGKNIKYNSNSNVLTMDGLTDITKYNQTLTGAKWIPLPSKTLPAANKPVTLLGSDGAGLNSYYGAVKNVVNLRSSYDFTELKNLIFNLPPFRTADSIRASTKTTSGIRDTADYVEMYLKQGGMSSATSDEKEVIGQLCATPVDQAPLEISISEFDTSQPARLSGEYAYYGPVAFNVNKRALDQKAKVKSISEGVSLVNGSYADVAGEIVVGDSYYLKVNNKKQMKNIQIMLSISTPAEHLAFYTDTNADTVPGYCIVPYVTIREESASIEAGSFGKFGHIRVRLTDQDTGQALSGVAFEFSSAIDGAFKCSAQTNELGYATSPELPVGKYKVMQMSVNTGYEKSTTAKYPSIITDSSIVDIAFTNARYQSSVRLFIKDESGKAINGGMFGIYQKDELIASGIADDKGSYQVQLKAGVYTAKQLEAKEGYVKDQNVYTFEITSAADQKSYTFVNTKIQGSVCVGFYDPTQKDMALTNGRFHIVDGDGNVISGPHNMEGAQCIVNNLPAGTYYVQQLIAPTNYKRNDNLHIFTITSKDKITTVTIPNLKQLAAISITAVDEDHKYIENVEFSLIDKKSGREIGRGAADGNGKLVFSNLPVGADYQVKVLKVPEGIKKNTDIRDASPVGEGQVVELTYSFAYIRGTARIKKINSSTLAGVKGAVFSIRKAGNMEVSRVTTGTGGYVDVPLSYGNYTAVELDPGAGYVETGQREEFTISSDGDNPLVLFYSNKIKSEVVISAHRSTGVQNVIEGAAFELYHEDGTLVKGKGNITTNAFGQAKISGLEYGSYYLIQTGAPVDCIPYKEPIAFRVTQNNAIVEIEVANAVKTGSITLLYRDKDTHEPIFGAEFTLYNADTHKAVDSQYTSTGGIAFFNRVPYGNYYIKMTKAAPGYVLDDSIIGMEEEEQEAALSLFLAVNAYAGGKAKKIIIDDNNKDVIIGEGEKPDTGDEDSGSIGDSGATVKPGGNEDSGSGENGNSGNEGSGNNGNGGNSSGGIIVDGEKLPVPSPKPNPSPSPSPSIKPAPNPSYPSIQIPIQPNSPALTDKEPVLSGENGETVDETKDATLFGENQETEDLENVDISGASNQDGTGDFPNVTEYNKISKPANQPEANMPKTGTDAVEAQMVILFMGGFFSLAVAAFGLKTKNR